ncbi:MAG: M23 family metallopeptidase, partial [Bacteroidota bacterium]
QGDCYKILYTTYEVDGVPAGFGDISAATFTHYGKETFAFRFDQGEGDEYFDQEGNSLRKTFLKAPLTYSRISSRFSYSRLHPILKIRRPHLGVDYAAPRGTPVVAVGEGIITKASWGGGGGKTVKVKHNGNYQTAYLHLSRYGNGISVGAAVKQGQIIGYVGSTGLSTGPHLDFRFYKNGRAVDPLKVDPPSANPIKKEILGDFQRVSESYMRKLMEIREDQPLQKQLFLAKHIENSQNNLNQVKPIQQ